MDHRAFVAGLTDAQRSALHTLGDGPGLWRLAVHAGLIALCIAIIVAAATFWYLSLPILGIFYAALFMLQHECTHKTPFRSRALNEAVGWIAGLILVQPFIWFRYFHLAHHRHTNDPERDPELLGNGKPATVGAYIFHLSTVGYWGAKIATLWQNALGRCDADYLPARARRRIQREAWVYAVAYAAAALFTIVVSPILLWIWFIPLIIGLPFLRFYLLAEHGHCPAAADMFENTRTTLTTRLTRFLAWNMPYHAEHHACPAVPFHKLPELHQLCAEHLKSVSDGYVDFHRRYVRTL